MKKRFLLTALMLIGLCLSVSAQKEEIYFFDDVNGKTMPGREFIDRAGKMYYFAGDSKECEVEIRNLKQNGNKETFDVYAKYGYEKGKKKGHIILVTDPDLDVKAKELDLSKQTAAITLDGYTRKLYFMNAKQYNKREGKGGGSLNPVDRAKEKGKDLLNKGKNLFKKKK